MADLPPIVLVFAATDPSGGAGLQADIMTLSSMGCHPLSVVTAITIQDTMGVDDVSPIDAEWVADQARCVLEDMPVAAFKIGLLGSSSRLPQSPRWFPIIPRCRWCSTRCWPRDAATSWSPRRWWSR